MYYLLKDAKEHLEAGIQQDYNKLAVGSCIGKAILQIDRSLEYLQKEDSKILMKQKPEKLDLYTREITQQTPEEIKRMFNIYPEAK